MWRPYAERTRIVATAIAEAEAAEQAGKHADARTELAAAITPTDPAAARGWIEARDAELPAITVLQRVAKAQQDWRAFVVDVIAVTWSRRRIAEADRELAAFILRGAKQYDAGDDASGPTLARAWLNQLTAAGLPAGVPEQELVVPRGTWFLAELPTHNWQNQAKTLTLSAKSLRFKLAIDANDKFCKKTNRVDRIDPDGSVRYEEECTYKPRKDIYTAEAALAEAAPAWALEVARTGGAKHERLFVLGKLAAAGGPRSWRLQDAVILDLRWGRF